MKPIGSLTPRISSAAALRNGRPESETEERIGAAERHALVLLSGYRRIDCDDPENWTTNAVAVLARYPEAVMAELCHPQSGLQTRIKWPPTSQEIREAGDIAMDRYLARERRAQLAQHRVLLNTPRGLLPEAKALPLLEAERKRMLAGFDALQADLRPARKREPPNMDLLKPRPVEPLSALAKAALGLKPAEAAE
jgi:hypothetical protein